MRRKNPKHRPPLPNPIRETKAAFSSNRGPSQIYTSVAAPANLRQKEKISKGVLQSYFMGGAGGEQHQLVYTPIGGHFQDLRPGAKAASHQVLPILATSTSHASQVLAHAQSQAPKRHDEGHKRQRNIFYPAVGHR